VQINSLSPTAFDTAIYSSAEMPGCNVSEIPHALVEETLERAKMVDGDATKNISHTRLSYEPFAG